MPISQFIRSCNAFETAVDMTGPADTVIEVSVATPLADGVWPVLCNWRAPVSVAGAVAAAPADPAAVTDPPGTADCTVMWVNKNPKELTERSRKHAPLACETVTTFVRSCSHTRYDLEAQWPHI